MQPTKAERRVRWFIGRHKPTTINKNILCDFGCPKCGNRENFSICAEVFVSVTDNGTDQGGDTEWSDNSYCRCQECNRQGTVADFTFDGLEDELTKRFAATESMEY